MSDDESNAPSAASSPGQEVASPAESGSPSDYTGQPKSAGSVAASGMTATTGEPSTMPVQKRRRVTRACDECRRKKIKCDGKQPCTHCSVYSYDCTYDKPSNRRRNPAPQYIEALENRLQRAETLLRKYVPDLDLSEPDLDPAVQQEFQNRERARLKAAKLKAEEGGAKPDPTDAKLISMIHTIGQLDLNEGGEWDFHGISSGAVFWRRMKEHFGGLLSQESTAPFLPLPPRPPALFRIDSPQSSTGSPWESSNASNVYDLPPREVTMRLCHYSLTCATCLLRIVHLPSFYESVKRLYEKTPDSFSLEDKRSLGLLYAVLALGCMYNTAEDSNGDSMHYEVAFEQGKKYYSNAKALLQDFTDCRDMTSLQALLFMILFLQATSDLGGCYAYLGIALRAALRMGLHRHLPHAKLNPIENESRRRVFYIIRQMDTYVSTLLGFPLLLREDDIDQPLPTEVDDEFITKDGILTPPPDRPSVFQAFNAHVRLMAILSKVIKYIYPLKSIEEAGKEERPTATYMISYSKIKEMESELQEWQEALPEAWRPSSEGPIEVVRVRTLLRFAFAHVQTMLYRPFLHYVSPRISAGKNVDERYYACAAAAISVSRNIVHIGTEIQKASVLAGPHWFILYTEFFAILTLVYYALENPDKPGSKEIFADAAAGRDIVASISQQSMAADRVSQALTTLFDRLPEKLREGSTRPVPSKKRSAPGAAAVPDPTGSPVAPASTSSKSGDTSRSKGKQEPGRKSSQHRMSFESGQRPGRSRQQQQALASYHEMMGMGIDMGSAAGSPDSNSTPLMAHKSVASSLSSQQQNLMRAGGANPFQKVDAMMFPSQDPFAYPNPPMMPFSLGPQQHQHEGSPHLVPVPNQQEAIQFYMPGLYDDIEGQLFGSIPPYMMQQQQQQQAQQQHGPGQPMYSHPNALHIQGHGSMHRAHTAHGHGQGRAAPARGQPQVLPSQQGAGPEHQAPQPVIEDMIGDPNFGLYSNQYRPL